MSQWRIPMHDRLFFNGSALSALGPILSSGECRSRPEVSAVSGLLKYCSQVIFYYKFSYPAIIMHEANNILKEDRGFNAQFVETGERPQNFIKNVNPSQRYNKYPKAQQLMQEKKIWTQQRNHPAVYLKQNLKQFDLGGLGKFDLIYCDPPWKQYEKRAKNLNLYDRNPEHYRAWTLQELLSLNVQNLADSPSFIFLWVGSQHLDDGRQLFRKWGFKRCEDIVWIKTNINKKKVPSQSDEGILVRVKEHCLVGYKGQAKKASDHNFIHPNIDIDVVVTEEPELGSLEKPIQFYEIIQRFCLGRKKIQIFGNDLNIRNGWLTIGNELTQTKFIKQEYQSWFDEAVSEPKGYKGWRRMGTTPVIQSLRPREDQKNDDEGKRSIGNK